MKPIKKIRQTIFIVIILTGFINCNGNAETNTTTNSKKNIVNDTRVVVPVKKNKPLIEILYMNHGPLKPVLKELREQFNQFDTGVIVSWYDFEKDEDFKKKKGIDTHIPLVIWLNNSNVIDVKGTKTKLMGFPKGNGPQFARGNWEIQDLLNAIKKAVGEK